jgi:hypothetical protein
MKIRSAKDREVTKEFTDFISCPSGLKVMRGIDICI